MTFRPLPGAYAATPSSKLMPLSSKNGPAKTSLFLILVSVVDAAVVYFWLRSANPSLASALSLILIALLVAAFVLAIAGLVLALRRPTRLGESVFALVLSSVLLIGTLVLFALGLVAAAPLDSEAVEASIQEWYQTTSGTAVTVDCPVMTPTMGGSDFLCSARSDAGVVEVVEVHVQGDSITWDTAAEQVPDAAARVAGSLTP